ncbi:MAG: two-component system, sensor histidine kinase and response regulator [Pyrinomonadaceae bacterium]|jgi:CheY-like chemotaxis protein|nr:two-component system, sensor histidine kinase and response regulator [Pyrinomonadaceae bacterium]
MDQRINTGTTILVAEDDEDNRFTLKVLLEMRGYRVLTAANGREAISVAERERPDLILMDLRMPELNGLVTTRQLRQHADARLRRIPIFALSAYDPTQHRAVAIAAGCDEYVTKPIDYDRLEKLLETFLTAPRNAPALPDATAPNDVLHT